MLTYVPNDDPVKHPRGIKRYGLNDHLGNVHTVVSDRRNRMCEGDLLSHYEADILNTYDYYAFGMMMPGRDFEAEVCSTYTTTDTTYVLNDDLNSIDPLIWAYDVATGSVAAGIWTVNCTGVNQGASALLTGAQPNTTYTVKVKFTQLPPSGVNVSIRDYSTGIFVLVWNASTAVSGSELTYTFTTNGSLNNNVRFKIQTHAFGSSTFKVDYVRIFRTDDVQHTDCATAQDGYRFGMNGQMKDDEIYGKDNSYTAEYWQYDPHLGRRWNVDPAFEEKPWMSPYHAFSNKPILNVDPNGASDSPIFDSETGNYLGEDSQGAFEGDVLHMNKDKFNTLSSNGTKTIDHDVALKQSDYTAATLPDNEHGKELFGKAYNTIAKFGYKHFEGKYPLLHGNEVHVADWGNDGAYAANYGTGHNQPSAQSKEGWLLYYDEIQVNFAKRQDLNTPGNMFTNFLHEYKGHGSQELGLTQSHADHKMIYRMQINHPSFKYVSGAFRELMMKRAE